MVFMDPALVSRLDAALCSEGGYSICELMERAGDAVCEDARRLLERSGGGSVLLLCGPGNNGGDAFAAGVGLIGDGFAVSAIELVGGGEARESFRERFVSLGGRVCEVSRLDDSAMTALVSSSALVIDGIFGAGGGRALPESVLRISRALAECRSTVLAIDIPTGVDGAVGEVVEGAIRADAVSMICTAKPGLYSYPARALCGEIFFHDIGISDDFIRERFAETVTVSADASIAALIPRRAPESHKGSFGRALLIFGSERLPGAAALATAGALRCGVGIACLASEEAAVACAIGYRPEATAEVLPPMERMTDPARDALCETSDGYDAVLVGCGSGKSPSLRRLIYRLLRRPGAPIVLDADAINSLAEDRRESLSRLAGARREVLLTPHPAEFSRLSGIELADIQASRMRSASEFAKKYGVNLILKGAGSIVAAPDGRVSVNRSGSPALAHGGTGDVLAGACVSFIAQGLSPFDAAVVTAHIHGRAGESLAETFSEGGVLAGDLPDEMAREIRRISL